MIKHIRRGWLVICRPFHSYKVFRRRLELQVLDWETWKTPGPDRITYEILKHFNRTAIIFLCKLFNAILKFQRYPERWKHSHVVLVYKKGKDKKKLESYRPISLVNTTSKIFEKIVLTHLSAHFADRIPWQQFGFRKERSTSLQLLRITELVRAAYGNKETTIGVFLDIQKAFDTVWHRGLIYKLIVNNTPPWIVNIIYRVSQKFCYKKYSRYRMLIQTFFY